MDDATITFAVLGVAVARFIWNRLPVGVVAVGAALAPGGYRFGDYWRLGLPLLALFFVVAVFLVPVIWAF